MTMSEEMKLYIGVLDIVPDHMVPVVVAHAIMGANDSMSDIPAFQVWKKNSYKKVVIKINQKEFNKIYTDSKLPCFVGSESTIEEGRSCCIIPCPVEAADLPNVLKFAKLWEPGF